MKSTEQYFPVVLLIILYKVAEFLNNNHLLDQQNVYEFILDCSMKRKFKKMLAILAWKTPNTTTIRELMAGVTCDPMTSPFATERDNKLVLWHCKVQQTQILFLD